MIDGPRFRWQYHRGGRWESRSGQSSILTDLNSGWHKNHARVADWALMLRRRTSQKKNVLDKFFGFRYHRPVARVDYLVGAFNLSPLSFQDIVDGIAAACA